MNEIEFEIIEFESDLYKQTVELRREILRRPLGIDFTYDQLAKEYADLHFAAFLNKQLIACLILTPELDNKIKMRQVAVANAFQSKGVGKKLISFAEQTAIAKGFKYIHCNARETAVNFYLKNGYQQNQEMFYEVKLPHYYMSKVL